MNTQKGFTFIELMLYVVLSALVLLVITNIYSTVYNFRMKSQVMSEVEQQGWQIMQAITQEIRNEQSITSPTVGNSGAGLTLASYTTSTNPTMFNLSSDVVNITEGTGSPIALNSNKVTVSNLNFQNVARSGTDGIIRISFTVTYTNPQNRIEQQYSKTFYGSAALRGVYP